MIEPSYTIEHDDGTGGDLPGWYVRRTMPSPVRAPPGGAVSIAGPFDGQARAERFLRLRKLDGSLRRMLPIPPAALMARQADPTPEGEAQVAAMRQANAAYKASRRRRTAHTALGREPVVR